MATPLLSKRKADAICNGIFFILLGILIYTNAWWPGILIAIGATFALRQYLTGRMVDFFITLSILAIIVLITFAGLAFSILLPVLFVLGGAYVIFREFFLREIIRFERGDDSNNPNKEH
jgi:hypothetical protein